MKIVVVSQRVDDYLERNEIRDALDQRLIQFLLVAGFIPVPIPNVLSLKTLEGISEEIGFDIWLTKINPQAVLLSGGNDIAACQVRDETEKLLLDYAEQKKLPVLGICRGMQMMGTWAGAKLKSVTKHVSTRHILTGAIEGEVNSYHNQAIAECPPQFTVLAYSEDGEIEAIRHKYLPWEGWMWHPEREDRFQSNDVNRLKVLFNE